MQSPCGTVNAKSLFFSLPPELRNHVYRLVLVEPNPILFRRPIIAKDRATHDQAVSPLLQVCQQIRNEALSIFFGENVFSFYIKPGMNDYMEQFLVQIGHQSLSHCNSVMLHGAACGMCDFPKKWHAFDINFQQKTVEQSPGWGRCEADDLNILQPAMQYLPRIIREIELHGANATDLRFLALQLIHALTDMRVPFEL